MAGRLAQSVASARRDTYPQGTWFVDLAPVRTAERLAAAVARALRLATGPSESAAESVVGAVSDWDALLVLDNCEHLLDAVDIGADADIGRPHHIAVRVAGIDGGFTAGLAEDIQLALRLDLDIGDCFVGDKDVGHGAADGDQLAAAD